MKLRNKKTAEWCNFAMVPTEVYSTTPYRKYHYNSLAELNEEWEDAPEEPKEYWRISLVGADVDCVEDVKDEIDQYNKEIGNYFETKEEAEKAVEKLKAIQHLKSHYIKFKLDFVKNKIDFTYRIDGTLHSSVDEERIIFEDLALLFGGEE